MRGRGAGLPHAPGGTLSWVRRLPERGAEARQASPICFLDRKLCRVNSLEKSHCSGSESQLLATATSVYKQRALYPPGPVPRSPQRVPPDVECSSPPRNLSPAGGLGSGWRGALARLYTHVGSGVGFRYVWACVWLPRCIFLEPSGTAGRA